MRMAIEFVLRNEGIVRERLPVRKTRVVIKLWEALAKVHEIDATLQIAITLHSNTGVYALLNWLRSAKGCWHFNGLANRFGPYALIGSNDLGK